MAKKKKQTIEVEEVDISEIKFDPTNPRQHPEANIELITSSVKDLGFARSIVIDENNQLIAGEGATQGSLAAGLKKAIIIDTEGDQIVAVRRRNLTPEEKERMKYVDNRANELSKWHEERLAVYLQSLPPEKLPETGFSPEDLTELLSHMDLKSKDLSDFFKGGNLPGSVSDKFKLVFTFEDEDLIEKIKIKILTHGDSIEAGLLSLLGMKK